MWWKREDEGSSSVVNCVWLLPKMTYKYVSWTSYTSAISQKQVLMVNAFILSSTHFSLKKKNSPLMSLLPEDKQPTLKRLIIVGQILRSISPYASVFIQGFVYMHPKST